MGDTFYNNRYDPEDHGHQILTLFQVIGILGLAIFAHDGLFLGYTGFVLSYVFIRIILAFLYYRTGKVNSDSRDLNYYDARNILIACSIWVLSIFFAPPLRFILLAIAIIYDVAAPIFAADKQQKVPVNVDHLIQRFGLFTVILLGEIVIFATNAVIDVGTTGRNLLFTFLGVVITFCIWWIYFENDNGATVIRKFFSHDNNVKKKSLMAGYLWVYAHLPLTMGLIILAVGLENIVKLGPDQNLLTMDANLFFLGLITSVASIGLMQLAALSYNFSQRLVHLEMVLPFLSVIAIILVSTVFKSDWPMVYLSKITLILLVQVIAQEYLEHKIHKHHH